MKRRDGGTESLVAKMIPFLALAPTPPESIYTSFWTAGELTTRGIVTPTTSDIYTPILRRLKAEGIEATFSTEAA